MYARFRTKSILIGKVNLLPTDMSRIDPILKRVFELIYIYVSIATAVFKFIFDPFVEFIESYSPTIGKSTDELLTVLFHFILALPFVLIALASSAIFFGDIPSTTTIPTIDLHTGRRILVAVFIIAGVVSMFLMQYVYQKTLKQTLLMSSLLILAAFPIAYVDPPHLFVFIAAFIYAIGAYYTTLVDFKVAYSVTQVLDKDNHTEGLRESVIYGIVATTILTIVYYDIAVVTESHLPSLVLLSVIAYAFTYRQQQWYESFYHHLRLKTTSRRWLFPTRIAIIFAAGLVLIDQTVTWYITVLFLTPTITFVLFYQYVTKEKQPNGKGVPFHKIFLENRERSRSVLAKQGGQNPIEDLNLDFSTLGNEDNPGGELELTLRVKIPEDMPPMYRPWEVFMLITVYVRHIAQILRTSDDDTVEEFDAFYNSIAQMGYQEMRESADQREIPWDEWPDSLVRRTKYHMHTYDDVTMDDIADAEIYACRDENGVLEESYEYVDLSSEDKLNN